ncbi:P-loop NTPase fold protein [Arthrobacter sp. GCM10027362]|uniref:KAP family P-loop NTPase fold protein n=1 Tax=Arthrobacter sp. GCM10027362 TaxID=3273379 RepID=UPI003642B522
MDSIWSDTEIRNPSEDRLDRGPFSGKVAALINSVPPGAESTVFGLIGPWGSGKSSLLHLVEQSLDSITPLRFSPWSVADESGLLAEFFSTLMSGSDVFKTKKNLDVLLSLAQKSLPALGAVPLPFADKLAETAQSFISPTNWDTQFKQIDKILSEKNERILVIVDDVDRLHGDEVLTLIKTIRMLGRFRNVHYLLSYDHDALVDALKPRTGGRARAAQYLEKIVQYPLAIPPAQRMHLRNLLFEGLGTLSEGIASGRDEASFHRFAWFHDEVAYRSLSTVRAVKRFVAQASHYLDLIGIDEVDLSDFLAVTLLRLHYPAVYRQLQPWKDDLLGTVPLGSHGDELPDESAWADRFTRLAGPDEDDLSIITATMKNLFPGTVGRTHTREHMRISHPDYFDRYFVFGIPEGDVSDANVIADIHRILEHEGDDYAGEDFSSTFTSPTGAVAALEKAQLHAKPLIRDPATAAKLAEFVLGILPTHASTSLPLPLSTWLGDLIVMRPAFEDTAGLEATLRSLPEIQVLQDTIAHADTLLAHVFDKDELPDPDSTALTQLKQAVSGIGIEQLTEFAADPPTRCNLQRFSATYKLLKECGTLDQARMSISDAIRQGDLPLVSVALYFVGDIINAWPSQVALHIEGLSVLVNDDILSTADLTPPPNIADSHEFDPKVDVVVATIQAMRRPSTGEPGNGVAAKGT